MKASTQVTYCKTVKRCITQREGRSSLCRRCPHPLFLALVLLPAVQHREASIKANLLIHSWIFLLLLGHHLPVYDTHDLILRLHPRLPVLCVRVNLYCPPNEYHSHLRWVSPATHLTCRTRHRRVLSILCWCKVQSNRSNFTICHVGINKLESSYLKSL